MEFLMLKNGVKLLYVHRPGKITSFCIGLNGGALEEVGFNYGTAHMVEHMVFKGTNNRNEKQINALIDTYFGFSNAMTNYPYAIYYGTLNSEDFNIGFEIYADILLNPIFEKEGFREEKKIILEELIDWRGDINQRCEDILLKNAFNNRRISELIIGNEQSIENISIDEILNFYERYYCPENCVISVVSSLECSEIIEIVEKYFGEWKRKFSGLTKDFYENNNSGIFRSNENIEGGKIQYCFPIHTLTKEDVKYLNLFNLFFGEGMNSILYDEIRSKSGLAYEIQSEIKNERGIKLFKINMSTSKKNIEKSLFLIDECIEKVKFNKYLNEENFLNLKKKLLLKNELSIEKSIELSKKITTHYLMYKSSNDMFEQDFYDNIRVDYLYNIINKVLTNSSIQILL